MASVNERGKVWVEKKKKTHEDTIGDGHVFTERKEVKKHSKHQLHSSVTH